MLTRGLGMTIFFHVPKKAKEMGPQRKGNEEDTHREIEKKACDPTEGRTMRSNERVAVLDPEGSPVSSPVLF